MPITRKKSKKDEDAFYISTDPAPMQKSYLPEILPSDVNTENEESNNTAEISSQQSLEHKKWDAEIIPSIMGSADYNSSSDEEEISTNHNTMKDIESISLKKEIIQGLDKNSSSYKRKNKRTIEYSAVVEKSLEQFLFGKPTNKHTVKRKLSSESSSDSSLSEDDEIEPKNIHSDSQIDVEIKNKHSDQGTSSDEEVVANDNRKKSNETDNIWSSKSNSKHGSSKPKAAWHDDDDEVLQVKDVASTFTKAKGKHGGKDVSVENYAQSLRRKFTALKGVPKWADVESQEKQAQDEDSDDEFFRETTDMLNGGKRSSLAKGLLEYRKLKDINEETHNEGTVIRSAEFHPSASVGLVAGLNGSASLFQIDGKSNPKMQTVNFENFPIKTAHFTSDGKQFIVGSQHFSHFFMYDMIAGKTVKVPWKEDGKGTVQKFEVSPAGDIIAFHGRFGNIHFYSDRTRTNIFTLKMNDDVTSCSFSPDGEILYSHGTGGEVYVWDVRAQDCIHRFWDDGCVQGTALAVSRNNRYLATGSSSGIVNIYNRSELMKSSKPSPEKVVTNLTTTISQVKFNPTSEILALASEVKENAIKILHLPSMSVFQNFPPMKHNLRRPNCMDFSTNGGYFSVGNNRGAANLFR